MSLHTSFLRVISHHDALSGLHSRLPLVNRTTDYTVAPVDASMRATGGDSLCRNRNRNRKTDDSSSKFESTTKLWRLWPWLLQPAVHQVNLLALLLPLPPQEQGDYLASTMLETRSHYTQDEFANSLNWRSTTCAFPSPTTTTTPIVATERNDVAYSLLLQTTMEPLPHGLWSCSSKPLTGRTGHYRLRDASVYWNHWRYTLDIQESLPLPDKDSSHDDMPCRTPLH